MIDNSLVPRKALAVAADMMAGARGIVINGPRQSGKSELLKLLAAATGANYTTLDEPIELKAARTDPSGFLARLGPKFFIDEVQRGGDPLVLAIKRQLDSSRAKGQCVLAGSTRFLFEPRLSESLAGRVRILDLWPLSIGEIEGEPERFVDALFSSSSAISSAENAFVVGASLSRSDIAELIVRGGFPEVVTERSDRQRQRFFEGYVDTITQRDVRELSTIHHGAELRTVLRLTAARTAQELNIAKFAETANLGAETTRRYLPLLQTVFLHHLLPPWSGNHSSRAVRRPKLHMVDTGLACHLLGVGVSRFSRPDSVSGHLFETFVVNEILKQLSWNDSSVRVFHWRDRNGAEVDLVLERTDGAIVGVECKLAMDVGPEDFKGLRKLRDAAGDAFRAGVVIHLGDRIRSFGEQMTSVPVSCVWRMDDQSAPSV
jgi:uncharacterized protein